jgi:glycosyltransferase involved in cell wall biosynthesis
MLAGNAKDVALANAEFFVLPTRSENFGIAIAEALAHGTPVITTKAAPWSELVTSDCGWWIDASPTSLATVLADAMAHTTSELDAKGRRGRQLIAEKYSWESAALRMKAVYDWIVRSGERPDCVREL